MSTVSSERKQAIITLLKQNGQVKVIALAEQFKVAPETIRRDLQELESNGMLRRVYGGATAVLFQNHEAPFVQRQSHHQREKAAIGRCAADLIQDGDTIVIDVGTTPIELVKAIHGRKRLTILTNGLSVAFALMEKINYGHFSGKVIVLGGELNSEQQSISGILCEKMMRNFRVNKAFISVGGISLTDGISEYDPDEASMSQTFAKSAEQVIVIADHSKLGVRAFSHMLAFDEVDTIVCDTDAPEGWIEHLKETGVQWLKAHVDEG